MALPCPEGGSDAAPLYYIQRCVSLGRRNFRSNSISDEYIHVVLAVLFETRAEGARQADEQENPCAEQKRRTQTHNASHTWCTWVSTTWSSSNTEPQKKENYIFSDLNQQNEHGTPRCEIRWYSPVEMRLSSTSARGYTRYSGRHTHSK